MRGARRALEHYDELLSGGVEPMLGLRDQRALERHLDRRRGVSIPVHEGAARVGNEARIADAAIQRKITPRQLGRDARVGGILRERPMQSADFVPHFAVARRQALEDQRLVARDDRGRGDRAERHIAQEQKDGGANAPPSTWATSLVIGADHRTRSGCRC